MGMIFSVYVGPYVEATGVSQDILDKHFNLLCDGRGELSLPGVKYLVPNQALRGVIREMRFTRDLEPGVAEVTRLQHMDEMGALHNLAKPFLRDIKKGTWEIKWGVIPCMS